ncbi:MAG: LCP family protein [Micrococcales bacterium]|nr:LCP family protein [Micrococcales bacterium]MCL2667200.1 LCP family protein [Micrococcales bacterium]
MTTPTGPTETDAPVRLDLDELCHGPDVTPGLTRHGRPPAAGWVVPVVVTVMVVTVLTMASAVGAVLAYNQRAMTQIDVDGLVEQGPRPPADPNGGRAVNVLLLGSDSRLGDDNQRLGGKNDGMRTDTTIVVHVSADRGRVELVSIPRDSLVDIPACKTTSGKTIPPSPDTMINAAFSRGWTQGGDLASAAACAWTTVASATGLHIDHVALIDFAGFEQMVNAVNGVDIYLDEPMRDTGKSTALDLPAGKNHLNGRQALDFVRARHVTGTNGSDITRITHQQMLLRALAEKVMDSGLSDAAKLTKLVGAVSASLTVDKDLSASTTTALAYSLRSVSRSDVVFATIPWRPDPSNPNRVRWADEADAVWTALRDDTPVSDVIAKKDRR